jgi:ubiquitin carboxyl-terminal hydrolase 34
MNPQFRRYVFEIANRPGMRQDGLIYQIGLLFAMLQDSLHKSLDTQAIADTIETYDGGSIDYLIQMDVDEAFNLLFDRLESQLQDGDEKKRFRSIYGGQIVQQIKSKECDHVSERLEPFSAIQCDIQGKQNLYQSLSAYVEGEIMDGGENCHQSLKCSSSI